MEAAAKVSTGCAQLSNHGVHHHGSSWGMNREGGEGIMQPLSNCLSNTQSRVEAVLTQRDRPCAPLRVFTINAAAS